MTTQTKENLDTPQKEVVKRKSPRKSASPVQEIKPSRVKILTSIHEMSSELPRLLTKQGCDITFKEDIPEEVYITSDINNFYILRNRTFETRH